MVGAVFAGHFTPVNVPVKFPAPVLMMTMNDFPAVAVGMVNVQFPVKVYDWTVAAFREMV